MAAEVLYRDDVNKFSVYYNRDIPIGTPRSGWMAGSYAAGHFASRSREIASGAYDRRSLAMFKNIGNHGPDIACAVLDEHAGSLLAQPPACRFTVGMRVRHVNGKWPDGKVISIEGTVLSVVCDGHKLPMAFLVAVWAPIESAPTVVKRTLAPVSIPAEEFYRAQTENLGARHGEIRADYRVGRDHPECIAASQAWSAHLASLVNKSDQERRNREPSVGWDPYGEE